MLRAMATSAATGGTVPPRRAALFALGFAVAALVPALVFRGFTVDDALITARYAAHIASGAGYRASVGGPITDGVTPLGFAYVLAPFAGGGPLAAFAAAKVLGVAAWTFAAGVMGLAVARVSAVDSVGGPRDEDTNGGALWMVPFALIATSAPLGAWAAAGMETGLVTALAALAAALPLLGRPRAGMVCAGLAAGWRPELLPWAATLGIGLFLTQRSTSPQRRAWATAVLPIAPFVLVAVVRGLVFGRAAPLSIFAKAPDARLGAMYAVACAILAGPAMLVAPRALWRVTGFPRVLAVSVLVHLIAVALAGGDWMPLSRLLVPVLPSLALAALHLARHSSLAATAVRLGLAVAGQTFVLVHVGPAAAAVGADRLRVRDELRPALAGASVVASLDIGWVGAATNATIVDLAGVTDPIIAALPGGHTTKQIPIGLFDSRRVDTLVLLLAPGERAAQPWTRSRFARGVEAWVATTPGVGETFEPVAESSLPHLRYVVLRRKP